MNYVAQSGRPITIRHREHIRYIKTNNPASAYATNILSNRLEYGIANDTLKLIQPCRKSKKMNHWENMYIYRQQNLLITEQQVNEPKPLYELTQIPHAIRDSSQPNIPQTSTSGRHTHRQHTATYQINNLTTQTSREGSNSSKHERRPPEDGQTIVTETCRVLIMCFTNIFNNLVF